MKTLPVLFFLASCGTFSAIEKGAVRGGLKSILGIEKTDSQKIDLIIGEISANRESLHIILRDLGAIRQQILQTSAVMHDANKASDRSHFEMKKFVVRSMDDHKKGGHSN